MLSDCDISNEWEKHKDKLQGWDYGGTEVMYEGGFEEAARTIESAATAPLLARIAELETANEALETANEALETALAVKATAVGYWIDRCAALERELEEARKDAERYRWLRDVSVPPHNFYISVPDEFHGVRYAQRDVDQYIDAAIRAAIKEQT